MVDDVVVFERGGREVGDAVSHGGMCFMHRCLACAVSLPFTFKEGLNDVVEVPVVLRAHEPFRDALRGCRHVGGR